MKALMPTPQERALLLADRLFVQAPEPPIKNEATKEGLKTEASAEPTVTLESQSDLQKQLGLTHDTFQRIQTALSSASVIPSVARMREAHRRFRAEIIKLTTNLGTLVENIRWTFSVRQQLQTLVEQCGDVVVSELAQQVEILGQRLDEMSTGCAPQPVQSKQREKLSPGSPPAAIF